MVSSNFTNNTMSSSTYGIQGSGILASGYFYASNNTISNTTYGIYVAPYPPFATAPSNQVFEYNSITNSTYGIFIANTTDVNKFTSNTFSRNTEDVRVENSTSINFLGHGFHGESVN